MCSKSFPNRFVNALVLFQVISSLSDTISGHKMEYSRMLLFSLIFSRQSFVQIFPLFHVRKLYRWFHELSNRNVDGTRIYRLKENYNIFFGNWNCGETDTFIGDNHEITYWICGIEIMWNEEHHCNALIYICECTCVSQRTRRWWRILCAAILQLWWYMCTRVTQRVRLTWCSNSWVTSPFTSNCP